MGGLAPQLIGRAGGALYGATRVQPRFAAPLCRCDRGPGSPWRRLAFRAEDTAAAADLDAAHDRAAFVAGLTLTAVRLDRVLILAWRAIHVDVIAERRAEATS